MAINNISPGSYNSPSIQPQSQAQPVHDRTSETKRENTNKPPTVERETPSVNTRGQTVGTIVNTKA